MFSKYRETKLSELLSEDGYLVVVEGDYSLYDDELDIFLQKNVKNYVMLNKIYDNPQKLLELKDIKIDVFLFQTTGLNRKLQTLVDFYIEHVGNYPKVFVSVFHDGIDNFYKVLNLLDEYEVFRYEFIEDNECILVREDHNCKEKD